MFARFFAILFAAFAVASFALNPAVATETDSDTDLLEVVVPADQAGATETLAAAHEAIAGGHIAAGIGFIIAFLLYVVNTFVRQFIPEKFEFWVSLGAGILAAVAAGLIAGVPWYGFVEGILAALVGAGGAKGIADAVKKD